jgi:hypothetical protein
VHLTTGTCLWVASTGKGILVGPTDKQAQQIYLDDLIRSEIKDSKKEAFVAQIINDSYNFHVPLRLLPEKTP